MATDASLQHQFKLLQEQQQKKIQRRKQQQQEKKTSAKAANRTETDSSVAFGVDDDLDLKLADPPPKSASIYSEELVNHLNDQIRVSARFEVHSTCTYVFQFFVFDNALFIYTSIPTWQTYLFFYIGTER